MQDYTLGIWRASYRDYANSPTSICSAEPRWLQDQLSSVNGIMSRWLDKTSKGYEDTWSSDELSLLEEGSRTLPPLLEVHGRNLEDLARCSFGDERAYPDLRERGLELIVRVRERIDFAPKLQAYITARDVRDLWKRERHLREAQARTGCPARPPRRGPPPIYYAWQTEGGETRWLFCDGARVTELPGGATTFDPPGDLSARERRRLNAKTYLKAAAAYPQTRVDRAPALPDPQSMTAAER